MSTPNTLALPGVYTILLSLWRYHMDETRIFHKAVLLVLIMINDNEIPQRAERALFCDTGIRTTDTDTDGISHNAHPQEDGCVGTVVHATDRISIQQHCRGLIQLDSIEICHGLIQLDMDTYAYRCCPAVVDGLRHVVGILEQANTYSSKATPRAGLRHAVGILKQPRTCSRAISSEDHEKRWWRVRC